MKKLFIIGLILSACQIVTAQTIKHHSYTAYYRAGLKESDSSIDIFAPMIISSSTTNILISVSINRLYYFTMSEIYSLISLNMKLNRFRS